MTRYLAASIFLVLAGLAVWSLSSQSRQTVTSAQSFPASQPTTTESTDNDPIIARRGTSGFWQLVQTDNGVWWFQSPDGRLEFLNTVTTVQPFQLSRQGTGPHFVSSDYDGGPSPDGNLEAWADRTLQRIQETGFKGLGAWCHPIFHTRDIPITRDLNVWTWMPPESKRLYSAEWATIAEFAIKNQVEPLRDNRNLVGYFTDNELDWSDEGSGPGRYFDNLPDEDPNRIEVLKVIEQVWPTIEDFNADWKTTFTSFDEVRQWQVIPRQEYPAYTQLMNAWLGHLAYDYFHITSELLKKYDPNHLNLGVRFRGYAPREVVVASKDFTDAQSINYYVGDGKLDFEMFRMMHIESGQPVMIGEYSFHALDGRSGNRNTVGFAAQVLDQQARAEGYRLLTTNLARIPYLVGCDWFQWMDEPPAGRSSDGEDVNFGVVDVDDRPYAMLVDAIRETTPRLNPIHSESATAYQTGVWRESFASKPVMNVPYLREPIKLNGELSDWPAQAKLQGIRHSQTVGLERSSLPVPNIYLGWNESGLYIGMEVFDRDIQGAPANGWWWTRDNVEFWISTRPVVPDQDGYDVNSHQFFFVPQEFPAADGIAGAVGQWHRSGDALADHLIPHPLVTQSVRILHDRYIVEMLIPPAALNNFDPQQHPTISFNVHVRNFQHATDYFWSAPKEVLTQLRPKTWGTLVLEPAP